MRLSATGLIITAICGTGTLASEVKESFSRFLQNTGFVPLSCNNALSTAPCELWSTEYGTAANYTSRVTIHCGRCIMMDLDTEILYLDNGIDIRGKLVFPDDAGYKLTVYSPLILVQGELEMRATKPVNGVHNIKFIMTGNEDQFFTPISNNAASCDGGDCKAGKKSITVAGGKVTIHGLPPDTPTWLNLYDVSGDSNSPSGIIVKDTVMGKWVAGAEILITSHTRTWHAHQPRTVVSVSNDNIEEGFVLLELDVPITRPTTAKESPDFAVEVALLSRNILFEGGSDLTASHGGHFWFLATPGVAQTLEGVELKNFGQQGNLGRYPIHFHICRDASGSVVAKNSIRESNQRCVVIHGTDNVRIEENVAYDTQGHCYILEDGIEMNNEFIRNLGAQTGKVTTKIAAGEFNGEESDMMPSTFWITNPANSFVGNVAAGAADSGFWFETQKRGPLAHLYPNMEPNQMPLILFRDNVAHSNPFGIRTYPRNGLRPPNKAMAHFDGCKIFRNHKGFFIHVSHSITVENGLFADNSLSLDIDRDDDIVVRNNRFIGVSDIYKQQQATQSSVGSLCSRNAVIGLELHTYGRFHDILTGVTVEDNVFSKFAGAGCSKNAAVYIDNQFDGRFGSYTTLEANSFEDGDYHRMYFCDASLQNILVYFTDLDGGLSPPSKKTTKPSTLVADSDTLLRFIDDAETKCTLVEGDCYRYCEDTCFRSVEYEIPSGGTAKWTIKACKRNDPVDCVYFTGYANDSLEQWARKPRRFHAHLPTSDLFDVTFVDENDIPVRPAFVKTIYQTENMCPGTYNDDDIRLVLPTPTVEGCTELIKNGDVEDSDTNVLNWQYDTKGIRLVPGGGIGGSNAAASAVTGIRASIVQFIDNACLSMLEGATYEVSASIKQTNYNTGEIIICNPVTEVCPDLRYKTTRLYPIGYMTSTTNVDGYQTIKGDLTISSGIANFEQVQIFIRTYSNYLMHIDNVSMKLINLPDGFVPAAEPVVTSAPTDEPIAPPTNAPIFPPTKSPISPPTNSPISSPTKSPIPPVDNDPPPPSQPVCATYLQRCGLYGPPCCDGFHCLFGQTCI